MLEFVGFKEKEREKAEKYKILYEQAKGSIIGYKQQSYNDQKRVKELEKENEELRAKIKALQDLNEELSANLKIVMLNQDSI